MKKAWKWGAAGALAGAAVVLLDALYLEQHFFRVKKFDIGIKGGQQKLKLLLLTDMHIKRRFWPFHARLARHINALAPDLIMITGDMLDDDGRVAVLDRFLSGLNPGLLKVAIFGNHDHRATAGLHALKAVYEKHHCYLLVNSSKPFEVKGQRLMITGLDDFIESKHDFVEAVMEVGREAHHLLLVHSPLQQEQALADMERLNALRPEGEKLNISYIFAGHNHGGQVRFFRYAPILPEASGNYVNGWYNKSFPLLYVSKGFGTSSWPVRFGARAEITLFNYYL